MRIRYLVWPLGAVACLILIYVFSVHFVPENEVQSDAVGVGAEMNNQMVAAGATAVSTPSASGVPIPAMELMLDSRSDEISDAVPDEAPDGSARLEEILEVWRRAAAAGVPEESLDDLRQTAYDPDPKIAQYAMRALEDLERFRDLLEAERAADPTSEGIIAGSDLDEDAAHEDGTLGEERDSELRLARMDRAITELNDPTNEDRLNSLLELWRAAADAGVPEEALFELQAAAYDTDPEIAESALRALEDLERFRDRLSADTNAELLPEENSIDCDVDADSSPLVYEQ